MKYTPKFDVGTIFYVPRVRELYDTVHMEDEHGNIWSREIVEAIPYAKCRQIISCKIYYTGGIEYDTVDYDKTDKGFLSRCYSEKELETETFATYEEAFEVAKKLAEQKQNEVVD